MTKQRMKRIYTYTVVADFTTVIESTSAKEARLEAYRQLLEVIEHAQADKEMPDIFRILNVRSAIAE